MVTTQTLAFGDFRLDPIRRRLIRDGTAVPLPERLFGVLSLLVQSNGAVVDKERFATVVWPDTVMTDSNLAQHIYQLRQLLGETARDRAYIMAASGRGYRLTAPVLIEQANLDRSKPTLDAHAALLKGGLDPLMRHARACHELERGTLRALQRAVELFEAALEDDRGYIPALLGLARAHLMLAQTSLVPPAPAFGSAAAALERALKLSSGSPTAHALRAELFAFGRWDWAGARREVGVAARLEPSSACVRASASRLLLGAGAYDQALVEAQLALIADPSSLTLLLLIADVFVHTGRYCDGIGILSKLLESDSTLGAARRLRAQAYLLDNRPAEAIADLESFPADPSDEFPVRLPLMARAYALCGDHTRAAEIYARLLDAGGQYVAFWNLAVVAAGLGKSDEAVRHLEEALEAREPALPFLKSLHWFASISQSPRFRAIVRAVNRD
jgi:DNA-binding winged helix-turn-helix (wHTH) protein